MVPKRPASLAISSLTEVKGLPLPFTSLKLSNYEERQRDDVISHGNFALWNHHEFLRVLPQRRPHNQRQRAMVFRSMLDVCGIELRYLLVCEI